MKWERESFVVYNWICFSPNNRQSETNNKCTGRVRPHVRFPRPPALPVDRTFRKSFIGLRPPKTKPLVCIFYLILTTFLLLLQISHLITILISLLQMPNPIFQKLFLILYPSFLIFTSTRWSRFNNISVT